MPQPSDDRPLRPTRGVLAGFLAVLAASTMLVAADSRPAQAQFGISIGGIGIGGGGFRSRGPRLGLPAGRAPAIQRIPGGRVPGMAMPRGGRVIEGGRFIDGGRGGRFIDGGRGGRIVDGPVRGQRPGRVASPGRFGDDVGPGTRPGGRATRPGGARPGGDDAGTRPPGNRPPGTRPPGNRPPDGRPPGARPPVVVGLPPPVIVLPPGGGGRLPPVGPPPGGGGLPPRGPGFGPAAAGAAALFGAPALISAARAAPEPRDVPGLPDPNERRYLPDEVLFVLAPNAPAPTLRNVVRRFNLTLIAEERFDLVGATVHRYRIPSRTTVPAAVRAMSAVRGVGYVQPNYLFERPNYVFRLQSASTTQGGGASLQYVVEQLRLPEAHLLSRGAQVPIAVIDSGVEATHPEMTGRIAKTFDAVGGPFQSHEHGTGMAGAIVAHAQLTGISPGANIFAARAFAPGQSAGASGTSFHILKAMDWSIREGARVINMSFAGPRDPMMTRAIQVAASRRIAMVAAMGNEGPGAPVSYPAADPDVIAVTATDQAGQLFQAASRGGHVTVAAPGVDIILPAPRGGYQMSSGTSVAAAHVSGIAALLIERQPDIDPAQLRQILRETARRGAAADPQLGAGLADPVPALNAAARPDAPSAPMVAAPPVAPTPDAPVVPGATAEAPPATEPGAAPRQATVAPGKPGKVTTD
jgi:hypothetical protein